jgi:hypothetical protein
MANTNKVISSVILAACFPVMAIIPSHPASLLFIFISGNKWVGTIRLAIALVLIAISFGLFRLRPSAKKPLLAVGTCFILFGVIALLATSLGSFMYSYIKIMDVMILLEAGIILCSAAITQTEPVKLTRGQTKAKSRTKTKVAHA